MIVRLMDESSTLNEPTDRAARLAEKARSLLDELRSVVWTLRNEQGSLAELAKLVDAVCRGFRGTMAYERTIPANMERLRIGPSTALATLTVAREFARIATRRQCIDKMLVSLTVDEVLELTLEAEGVVPSNDELRALDDALVDVRASVERALSGGHPECARPVLRVTAAECGARLRASIALDSLP